MTATGLVCSSCGIELPQNAKFCLECGAAVSTAAKPAEYKQVTVLFADVVGSMDIAAAVGAERLREIMTELVDRATVVVKRYGGTVDKFTGDGIMAVFGAPKALEDHAVRACLAALDLQREAQRLAAEIEHRDGFGLAVRVGLNSGQVIAGEIGSGSLGYTAIGEQVGLAQRMESVAPPGGVMLSYSTASLVENTVAMSESELVHVKGSPHPVRARRLLKIEPQHALVGRAESRLVGRRWEMAAVEGILDRAIDGHGGVIGVVGTPGIGKSRIVREVAAMAALQGIEVFTTFCESHSCEIPFHVVAQLLRTSTGVADLDAKSARAHVRTQVTDADPQDLLLVDDLLGIADPDIAQPKIDPDARRRRLTALVNGATLAREIPALYIVEDAHWIDEVSESMLADFIAVIPQTHSMALITYRPEYRGALTQVAGAQTIALAPLSDSESSALIAELLGPDPSVAELATMIAQRAAGNPFFAEAIVRDLAERGALHGDRGAYMCDAGLAEVSVPATLQATIAARIDRLDSLAKQTLSAAAVIGSRFGADVLMGLGIDPVFEDLVAAELIDQVKFTPRAEYAFHHPLIQTVAYEAQLKSDRAELHRRVAATIEQRDENAALLAEHLEASGDLHAAFAWHMRAGAWSATRDIAAAWLSWERACHVADLLPADDHHRTAMRIAPRTLLCGNAWRAHVNISGTRFEELRQLCAAADDKSSLAMGLTGLVAEHITHARIREASRLASEHMALIESIGDATLTVGLSFAAILAKHESGEMADVLRWAQRVINLADGDPDKGRLIIGSPLAFVLASRGAARWCLCQPGWRRDFDDAVAMARGTDPVSHAFVIIITYILAIANGVLPADDTALRDIDGALQIAERSGDDVALSLVKSTLGVALVHRDSADRARGVNILAEIRDISLQERFTMTTVGVADLYAAREKARLGDHDGAVPLLRAVASDLLKTGQLVWWILATSFLVESLLARGVEPDLQEAQDAIDTLAATAVDEGFVVREITLLRLRALSARAHGDEAAYRDYRDRYRDMARSLGFEGHIAWAEAMP
jgi:class 3 adenylate cyclase